MLRLLRLLKLDKYVPSVSLVDDLFRKKAHAFEVTGVVIGIIWVVFSTLLYATTKDDNIKFDYLTMGQRYHNIPNSFQYAFIHLSGECRLFYFVFLFLFFFFPPLFCSFSVFVSFLSSR